LHVSIPELFNVVPQRATNIYQQGGIIRTFKVFHESVVDRVKVGIHPAGTALSIAAHVVVELQAQWLVCIHPLKHGHLGVECKLVGSCLDIVGQLIVVLRHVLGEHVACGVGSSSTAPISHAQA
jgi:hypothetical protein